MVTLLPDEAYQKSHKQGGKAKFSGTLIVQNLDENLFVGAWSLKDDKITAEVEINRGGQSDRNGRRQCYDVKYDVWEEISQIEYNSLVPTCDCNTIGSTRIGVVGTRYYKFKESITVQECSGGGTSGSGNTGNGGINGTPFNNPHGGLYGGPSGSGIIYLPPFTPDPEFVASLGPIDRFFYNMANGRRLYFNDEEQDYIRANAQIIPALVQYAYAVQESSFGQGKPSDLVGFTWLVANGYPTTPNLEIRANFLKQKLAQDPEALLKFQQDLSDLAPWRTLAQKQPPQYVKDRINQFEINIGHLHFGSWIQYLNNAAGSQVNCDYFPIKIDRLPNGFSSPEQFLEYFRTHLNDFSPTSFTPHPNIQGEANKWLNDPLGAIISIGIPFDKGSVITIEKQAHNWVFATIHDPYNWNHPVSGNREFGVSYNGDGSFSLYIRGVDRVTSSIDELLAKLTMGSDNTPLQFQEADNLWETIDERAINFINQHGGQASSEPGKIIRARWDAVKRYLLGQ